MLLSTTDSICGKSVVKHLGLVKGNTVRTRHEGDGVLAILQRMVGGEVTVYTKLMAEAREQALDRMVEEARQLGGNAIIGVRFSSSEIMARAAEFLVYGTAVVVE
jgi:uncharacterized protein YbjQ (UPF0145 family)